MTQPRTQVATSETPAGEARSSPECFPDSRNAERLARLLERTLGKGFKLAVVESATPRDRQAVLAWLQPRLEALDAQTREVDLSELLPQRGGASPASVNVWAALAETIPPGSLAGSRTVLALWGGENLPTKGQERVSDLIRQFNVQRDLLVHDYPCFWLLFVHPAWRHAWWSKAPDFCDFAALWIESAALEQPTLESAPRPIETTTSPIPGDVANLPKSLADAAEAILLSHYDEALDLIHAFRAATPLGPETERDWAFANLMECDILRVRGELDEAMRRLRDEILPVFERLDQPSYSAWTRSQIADILEARGELAEALRIRREEELPVYERLGDVRSKAVTMGKIADVLHTRGELEEALRIRREEELPVYERLGDVREKAVTMGKITDVLQSRGELEEALRIRREEQLPVYERLGDVRSKAVTMGQIADVLEARGELEEALRIRREEELPVYERLGDVRSKAVTMGRIADVLEARGELEEALRIRREEQLPVFERLGDVRSKAVTMGKIADILQARGELAEALRIRREEQFPVYERLGDVRSKAVTMGRIADVLQARGELAEALRIHREEVLPVFERLGDLQGMMVCRANIAITLLQRGREEDLEPAVEHLKWALATAKEHGYAEAAQLESILRQSRATALPADGAASSGSSRTRLTRHARNSRRPRETAPRALDDQPGPSRAEVERG